MTVEQRKKVLILGGTRHLINYVDAFKKAGIYTIVVDDMAGASAKKHADQSFCFSPENVIVLADLVKAEGVTGVFAETSDITTWNAIALCKKTGLPFYTLAGVFQTGTEKSTLHEYCRVFGIKTEVQGESFSDLKNVPLELLNWTADEKPIVSLVG